VIPTTTGQTYVLAFDAGAFSLVNRNEQRLQVTVQGSNATLLAPQVVSVFAPGNGTTYSAKAFTFTADSSSATLIFQDVSPTTSSVDLMLDNIRVSPAVISGFTNGSFESDYTGWNATGNQNIQSSSPYVASNGVKVLTFNGGQTSPNGVLSQTFATTPGQVYSLSFDVGAFSLVNKNEQRLQFSVQGNTTLLGPQIVSVFAPGTGTTYASRSFTFTADRASTTLTFQDVSQTTTNVDLVLDNVRVTATGGP
jgi:Carbohydrate binding domain